MSVGQPGECCPVYKCTGSPPLPPPVVVSFRFDPDHQDMVNVTWLPVSLVGHPGISVDGYYVEVSRNRNGSDIVANGTAAAGDTSFVLSVGEYSDEYWVRIKAVQGNLDASGFSDWFAIDLVPLLPISGVCAHIALSSDLLLSLHALHCAAEQTNAYSNGMSSLCQHLNWWHHSASIPCTLVLEVSSSWH